MKGTKVKSSEKRKNDEVKPMVSKEERAKLKSLWNEGQEILREMGPAEGDRAIRKIYREGKRTKEDLGQDYQDLEP